VIFYHKKKGKINKWLSQKPDLYSIENMRF